MKTSTQQPAPSAPSSSGAADHLRDENVALVRRVCQLRAALEAATRDNAQLGRQLARLREENRRLTEAGVHARDRDAQVRAALSEPWSRNP